jgi:hypothetical protein
MVGLQLPGEWLDSVYKEIKQVNDYRDEPDTFLTDPRKGLANAAGITPDVYMAAFKDWGMSKICWTTMVSPSRTSFEATHRDKSGKKLSPASGMMLGLFRISKHVQLYLVPSLVLCFLDLIGLSLRRFQIRNCHLLPTYPVSHLAP